MPDIQAGIASIVSTLPEIRGFLDQPPISWMTAALTTQEDDASSTDEGRYDKASGALLGQYRVTRLDLCLPSSAHTGRLFDAPQGTWYDTWVHPRFDCYGLQLTDNRPDTIGEVIEDAPRNTGPGNNAFLVRKSFPPSQSPSAHSAQENYLYLYLSWNDPTNIDYRLKLVWETPLAIEYTEDSWTTVKTVKQFQDLGSAHDYLAGITGELRFIVTVDKKQKLMKFELGNGHKATHSPSVLPQNGHVRLLTKNGATSFSMLPIRAGAARMNVGKRDFGEVLVNLPAATVTANQLGLAPEGQTTTYDVVSPDGRNVHFSVEATLPDVGDGTGSDDAPVLADANLVVPAHWISLLPGPPPLLPSLRAERWEELSVWDDITRVYATTGMLTANNYDQLYDTMIGNLYMQLATSNGGPFTTRITGVAGWGDNGWELLTGAGDFPRQLRFSLQDFTCVMQTPLGFEQSLDRWYLGTAVRFLCEAGNVNPQFIAPNPALDFNYQPPATPSDAPYGPAGFDLPEDAFILPQGFGNEPRYRVLPGISPWQMLLELVQDTAYIDPVTGHQTPYTMGFDPGGRFHFEPFDPKVVVPTIAYSDRPDLVDGVPITGPLQVYTSVSQMRTHIDFQGLDAITYNLLYYHLPMPDYVKSAMGFRFPWLERSPRFVEGTYMQQLADRAAYQASLPVTIARFSTVHMPEVRASNVITLYSSRLPGTMRNMVITEMTSTLDGHSGEATSVITCRALENIA